MSFHFLLQSLLTLGMSCLLLFSGCKLNREFKKSGATDTASIQPNTDAKGDRPQETGEGLPGYLIDPSLLQASRSQESWTIQGAASAVRSRTGAGTTAQKLLVLAYKNNSNAFRREQGLLIVTARVLSSLTSLDNGSFQVLVKSDADDSIFIRLADSYADTELAFKPGSNAADRVMLDVQSNRFQAFDEESTQRLASSIDPVGTQQQQILTLKSTRACRSCNLSGVDLSSADLNGCILTSAVLVGTKFIGADIRNCQMQNANLQGADLTGADLSAADLTGANMSNATLTNAILTNTKGLTLP